VHGVRSRILDVLAALFVASIFWVPPLARTGRWPAAPLLVGVVAAILLCRRFPAWSAVAAATLTITGTVLGVTTDPMTAAAWCLYPLAFGLAGRVRAPLVVLTALIGGLAVVAGAPDEDPHGLGRRLLLSVVALTLSWLLGTMVGRQVAAERARVQLTVAREVHDVVGHALGVIGAEAGVTRSLPDATDDELRESLAGIERHARGALAEVQTLVRALRTPTPTPAQLTALVTAVRSTGVRVQADLAPITDIDPHLAASLFRIAQESLSNVVRHAPGSLCRITLAQEAGTLVLTVEDDGPPPPPASAVPPTPAPKAMAAPATIGTAVPGTVSTAGGSGLIGMRERARLVGGTVTWAATGPGFRVEARLPVRGRR
jgi:signal transduction histidine kinase